MRSLKDKIKTINLFSHLNDEHIDMLSSFAIVTNYEKDSILMYESDINNKLLFLLDGQIKVFKIDKFDNEIFLYYIYPYSMISELSSIQGNEIRCFSNTIFTKKSEVLSLDYKLFKDSFLAKDMITLNFINELIYKNQQLQCIINRELVFDATSKVAFMLINDLDMFNSLKRSEVSLMLHIQPETLSRILKKLTRREIIDIDKGIVSIIKNQELKDIYIGI